MDITVESTIENQSLEERKKMPVCPFCYSKKMRKYGFYTYKKKRIQKWYCEGCESATAFPLHRKPTHRKKKN
jgi:transposase-like protein